MFPLEDEENEELPSSPDNIENISEEEPRNKRRRHDIDFGCNLPDPYEDEGREFNYIARRNEFSMVKKMQETHHREGIYAVAFSPYDVDGTWSVFATAAKHVIHVYASDNSSRKVELKRIIQDTNNNEDYYALSWCFDQIEKRSRIIVAGECGFIKVIDPASGVILHEKFGHGDTVNELRTDPNNSMVFASVSKDNSARIWHLRKKSALIVLGGQKGHLDQDWSPDSTFLVTCSMDHSIKFWYLNEDAQKLFDSSLYEKDDSEEEPRNHTHIQRTTDHIPRGPIYQQFPCCETTDLHTDYVDCIRFVGWYLISKGTEKTANVFRFGHTGEPFHKLFPYKSDRVTTLIKTFPLPHCDVWFLKFDVSPQYDWAVFGGTDGKLLFFDLNPQNMCVEPTFEMTVSRRSIRQVCFSTCGNTIITVGDDSTITKIMRKRTVANTVNLMLSKPT